jgi:hypothetical protein
VTATVEAGFSLFGAEGSVSLEVSGSIAGELSREVSRSVEVTTEQTETTTFTSAGTVWQFQYDVADLCIPKWVLKTSSLIRTKGAFEPPCCLPGYALDPDNYYGPCANATPCTCAPSICFATPKPTANPISNPMPQLTPMQSPNSAPSPVTIVNKFCFSKNTLIEVKGKGNVTMNSLRIGDYVRVGSGHYSQVYAFGHYHESLSLTYSQVTAIGLDPPLEISSEHMVYIKDNQGTIRLIAAGDLKVGDVLVKDLVHSVLPNEFVIQAIVSVERMGVYAPFTFAGDIAVNGIVASNYLTLVGLPNNLPTWLHAWMSHTATAPRRVYCHYNMDWCLGETYDNEGYATWLDPILNFYQFVASLFASLPPVFQSVLLCMLVFLLATVRMLEFILCLPIVNVASIIIAAIVFVTFCSDNRFRYRKH